MDGVTTTISLSRLASGYALFDSFMHHYNAVKLLQTSALDSSQSSKKSPSNSLYDVHQFHMFATCDTILLQLDLTVAIAVSSQT